jgi:hypothetical protein
MAKPVQKYEHQRDEVEFVETVPVPRFISIDKQRSGRRNAQRERRDLRMDQPFQSFRSGSRSSTVTKHCRSGPDDP